MGLFGNSKPNVENFLEAVKKKNFEKVKKILNKANE